jgi:hypothetical protein
LFQLLIILFTESIQAKAIFVSCENYKEMTKLTQLGKQIRKLSHKLEDCAWEGTDSQVFLMREY